MGSLVTTNNKQLQREADLRFSLVRLRENAESIAFYGGEGQEMLQVPCPTPYRPTPIPYPYPLPPTHEACVTNS
jgi:hypothetical protein